MPAARSCTGRRWWDRSLRVCRAQGGLVRALQAGGKPLAQDPEYKELEFRWVPEGVTRLATLLAEEVHISDVDRALQQDAVAKGMKISTSTLHAMQHQWHFGGMYFATPEKLDQKVPFVDKRVRQAMNMAINRQAIANRSSGWEGTNQCVSLAITPSWTRHLAWDLEP